MFSIRAKERPISSISASDSSKFQLYICFQSFQPDFFVCFQDEDTVPPQEFRIDCKFQCQAAAKRAIRSILSANCTPPCGCRTRSTGFPSASSSLDPFDTVALSRTHPTPSETTTHPNHPMKRFKKKNLNQHHKNLNTTTPSPSFHLPNKKPRKQHAPPNFQAED